MAVVSDPLYPVASDTVTVSLSVPTGNVVFLELTSVPDQSALETGTQYDDDGARVDYFIPDAQGAYGVTAYDYRRYSGLGASHPGDPVGDARDELVAVETGTVYVGDSLDLPVTTLLGHSITIRIGVFNGTVRTAEFVNPTTEVARLAALDETALASLAALEGVAVTALDDKLQDGIEDLRSNFERHRVHASHSATDAVNVITRRAPYSNTSAIDTLNEIRDRLVGHMMPGTTGTNFHSSADDTKNLPIAAKAIDEATATVLSADLRWRVYTPHRTQTASPASHTGAGDTVDVLNAITPLAQAIRDTLSAIAAVAPTAPNNEQQGAIDAAHRFGFKRAA